MSRVASEAPTRTFVPPWDAPPVNRPARIGLQPEPRSTEQTPAPVAFRWRVISLLILGAYAACFARELAAFGSSERWLTPTILWAALLLQSAAAALAWAGRPGVRRIRLVEWGSLAVACLLLVGMQFEHFTEAANAAHAGWALPWFALIVAYGTLSPTSHPRRLAWAACLAGMPLVVTAVCVGANPGLRGEGAWASLAELGVWTGTALAIAAYGSHRIDRLKAEARVAKQLGQYRLVRRLAGGGMGNVFLAEHALLRRPCAIKVIAPDRSADQASARRFEREVQAMASLTHWNTAEVFDYGHTTEGTFYYVMEYLPGLTLEEVVRQFGPVSPARAVHFLRQVCAALREAHDKGLVHRDLKPSNIMICERGGVPDVVKLLDFGLVLTSARTPQDERLTGEGAVLGTPSYMSPEQAAGKSPDERADLYALGATAFFLLTGRPPFERSTAMQVLAAHLLEPAQPPSAFADNVPAELDSIILRCLAKHPAERYASVRELDRALAACPVGSAWTDDDALAWWRPRGGSAAALAEAAGECTPIPLDTPAGGLPSAPRP